MSNDLDAARTDALLGAINVTREQARHASLVLAGHASGADELKDWLETCGLMPPDADRRRDAWGNRPKTKPGARQPRPAGQEVAP